MYQFQENVSFKWFDHLFKGDVRGYLVDYFHTIYKKASEKT